MGVATTTALAVGTFIAKTGIGKPFKWLWHRNVSEPLTAYLDRRQEFNNEVLALRFDAMDNELKTIRAEVTPNGGGSMKDALKRVEAKLEALEDKAA